MNLSRWRGLELPVLPPDTDIAVSKTDFQTRASLDEATFTRAVIISSRHHHRTRSLQRLLQETDQQFTHVANMTGARVVDHGWGLYRLPKSPSYEQQRIEYSQRAAAIVPAGHVLVATVATIRTDCLMPFHSDDQAGTTCATAIDHYYDSRYKRRYTLGDMALSQFVYGTKVADDDNIGRQLWLLDIDPLIQKH